MSQQAGESRHSVSVAAVVVDHDGRVLVARRRDNGRWEPPGGVLELDESIPEGLRREVYEETGLTVYPDALTGVYKKTSLAGSSPSSSAAMRPGERSPSTTKPTPSGGSIATSWPP